MARPARVGLYDAVECHLAGVHQSAKLADLALHVVDALGSHFSHDLAGLCEVCVKTEEVDAVLQREDLRLAVQPKAERLDVRLDLLEYLPEQQLVAVDDVEVVHVPAIYEAAVIPQPVVEGVQIEQREQLARLVADRDAGVWRAVDYEPQQPLSEVDQLGILQPLQGPAGRFVTVGMEQGVKEL